MRCPHWEKSRVFTMSISSLHTDQIHNPQNSHGIYIFHLFSLRLMPALLCFKTIYLITSLPWQCGQAFNGLIRLPCQNIYMYYAEIFNYTQNVTIRFHLQYKICTVSLPSSLLQYVHSGAHTGALIFCDENHLWMNNHCTCLNTLTLSFSNKTDYFISLQCL